MSVGALYHHFPDKPALAAAVYAQLISEYQAGFVAMLREQHSAEGGIRGGVAYHLRWVTGHRAEARLLLGDRDPTARRCATPIGSSSPPSGTGGARTTPYCGVAADAAPGVDGRALARPGTGVQPLLDRGRRSRNATRVIIRN